MNYQNLVSEGDDLWKRVIVSRCTQYSEIDDNNFVYGYQLSNPRQILSEWANHGGENVDRMSFPVLDGLNLLNTFDLLLRLLGRQFL